MKKLVLIVFSIILFGGTFFWGSHLFYKKYHNKVKNSPQMFCYENYRGGRAISVIFIKNLKNKDYYIKYYEDLSNGLNPYLPMQIELNSLPQYNPVYVIDYSEDSILAKVVSYYDRGNNFGGSFTKGWVYAETLHETPPPPRNQSNAGNASNELSE